MLADAELLEVAGERLASELRAVVSEDPGELDPMPSRRSATWSTKLAASRADLSPATRVPMA